MAVEEKQNIKPRAYRVKSPLRHNGKHYDIDSKIVLDLTDAALIGKHAIEPWREKEEQE